MRFLVMVIPNDYAGAAPDAMPDPETIKEMMKYNEALAAAGVLKQLDGLHPPAAGNRVKFAKGKKPLVVDGPFTEAKEAVGGFWIFDVRSKAEAIEWATRAPMADGDTLEIRQIHELADFPPDHVPERSEALKKIGGA